MDKKEKPEVFMPGNFYNKCGNLNKTVYHLPKTILLLTNYELDQLLI